MKVMVLGGRGFVGRAVVNQLVARGDTEVLIASRSANGQTAQERVKQLAVDSCDETGMVSALAGIDAVINCVTGDGTSISRGAEALVNAAALAGMPRIVHLSTMSVYGSAQGVLGENTAMRDDLGWYGHAKIEAERHMNRYATLGGQVVILRPGVIIGPGSDPWVGRIARWLMTRHLADLGAMGDGPANLVDVDDVAQATVLALRHPLGNTKTAAFNLAAPDSPRWNEYFRDLTLTLNAGPLQRWGARRLKFEVLARGIPLKAIERICHKLNISVGQLPEGIPPSLTGLWSQQVELNSELARESLSWTPRPYERTLQMSAAWIRP